MQCLQVNISDRYTGATNGFYSALFSPGHVGNRDTKVCLYSCNTQFNLSLMTFQQSFPKLKLRSRRARLKLNRSCLCVGGVQMSSAGPAFDAFLAQCALTQSDFLSLSVQDRVEIVSKFRCSDHKALPTPSNPSPTKADIVLPPVSTKGHCCHRAQGICIS